jgi:hypothetical protein
MTEPTERDREMAQAHWEGWFCDLPDNPTLVEALAETIAAARAEERERCAKIAKQLAEYPREESASDAAHRIAAKIRSGE